MAEIDRPPTEEKKLKIVFNPVPKSLERPFIDFFPSYANIGMVRGEPGGYLTSAYYAKNADKLFQLKVRESDAWVVTYPKSGTTWVSELVWLLKNDLNYEVAAQKQLKERVLFPEISFLMSNEQVAERQGKDVTMKTLDEIDQLPSPRCFNPHLTLDLLPENLLDVAKVVYVARNPKDVMVSYYHFHKASKHQFFTGNFEQFVHYFLNDEIVFTPYFHHVLSAWEKRFHPNMHFIFYEQMKMDLRGEIKKAASFFNKSLSDNELDVLENHLDFKNFKNNESANWEYFKKSGSFDGEFMRKGIIGDWKNHFSPELNQLVDDWIKKNLNGSDLKFIME